ncbi:MAG: serine/threonine protein kinase [Candidatus Aminicenantes bacterium]|nr:serine/threonine protein kinase [Candidatus Aminicenantes bacterium]
MEKPNIPGYKIKKTLGAGGMSRVYLAVDDKLKRPVALKVLLPTMTDNSRLTRRFIKEARTAAHLHHSNIVSIYDVGKEKDCYYIAMEHLEESLKDKLNKNGSLKPTEALHIIKETAKALSYAHKKGYIHRDIKPDNIMFRSDGAVVLVDFGIAKALHSDTKLTRTGVSIGTPKYMSPEQVRALKVDGRADIYSLGIVLYETLVGKAPYQGKDAVSLAVKHMEEPVPQFSGRLKPYQPLLGKMLAKSPKDRVKDAEGLIRLIDATLYQIKQEKQAATTKIIKPPGKIKTAKSSKARVVIILAVIAALIVLGIFLYTKFFS